MFSSGFRTQKLKTNLKLSINRLKLLEKKKTELAVKARREISEYLAAGKEDRARIRVEHIVREDYYVEAMELIEMYCDLLLARMGLIETTKELDPGLEESIASIIWAAPRMQADVAELRIISEQLALKYGKEFGQACRTNQLNNVNAHLLQKMSVESPPALLIERYLVEIARTYNIPYVPDPALTMDAETMHAEGLLIDFNSDKNNKDEKAPVDNSVNSYSSNAGPVNPTMPQFHPGPPLPEMPPVAAGAPPFVPPGPSNPPQVPPYDSIYDNNHGAPPYPVNNKAAPDDQFPALPELPSVPTAGVPSVGSNSSEDIDFNDLTKRFEQLKKQK